MDGVSFAPALLGQVQPQWKDAVLVEYQSIRDQISVDPSEARSDEYISAYGYRVDEFGRCATGVRFNGEDFHTWCLHWPCVPLMSIA